MKIHKVVLTIIDFDGVGVESIKDILETTSYPNRCITPRVRSIETKDIGEWSDDHPLNDRTMLDEKIRRLFDEKPIEGNKFPPYNVNY